MIKKLYKNQYLILLLVATFSSGVILGMWTGDYPQDPESNGDFRKVTGIGGIFFKADDPTALKAWYAKHLGLQTDQYGTNFEWIQANDSTLRGFTQWSPFSSKTTYFAPSEKEFMINYRVDNLERLIEELQINGVKILDEMESYDYGKFVHILDPENNKIELWEPIDHVYDKYVEGRTK